MPDALARLPLACPLDGAPLAPGPHGLACPAGHNHDVARAGYASLLPVAVRGSKAPGDDARMVAARRRVLDAGLFEPVCEALGRLVHRTLDASGDASPAAAAATRGTCLVDAGCGEGWYTDRLRASLATRTAPEGNGLAAPWPVLGIDVSRPAILAAARRYPDTGWAVANNRAVPVVQGRAAIVTSLFGFETWAPWARLQAPGQHVLTVGAGPAHLIELRELVYGTVRVREAPRNGAAVDAGYACVHERRVEAVHAIGAPELARDALAMTPHAHRVPAARAALVEALVGSVRELTVDVVLRCWRRTD